MRQPSSEGRLEKHVVQRWLRLNCHRHTRGHDMFWNRWDDRGWVGSSESTAAANSTASRHSKRAEARITYHAIAAFRNNTFRVYRDHSWCKNDSYRVRSRVRNIAAPLVLMMLILAWFVVGNWDCDCAQLGKIVSPLRLIVGPQRLIRLRPRELANSISWRLREVPLEVRYLVFETSARHQ